MRTYRIISLLLLVLQEYPTSSSNFTPSSTLERSLAECSSDPSRLLAQEKPKYSVPLLVPVTFIYNYYYCLPKLTIKNQVVILPAQRQLAHYLSGLVSLFFHTFLWGSYQFPLIIHQADTWRFSTWR